MVVKVSWFILETPARFVRGRNKLSLDGLALEH
jgi:hypothetical protein